MQFDREPKNDKDGNIYFEDYPAVNIHELYNFNEEHGEQTFKDIVISNANEPKFIEKYEVDTGLKISDVFAGTPMEAVFADESLLDFFWSRHFVAYCYYFQSLMQAKFDFFGNYAGMVWELQQKHINQAGYVTITANHDFTPKHDSLQFIPGAVTINGEFVDISDQADITLMKAAHPVHTVKTFYSTFRYADNSIIAIKYDKVIPGIRQHS